MASLLLICGTSMRIFYSIMLSLDSAIYWCVDVVYSVFIVICNTQLFSATTFEAFSSRIYAILGVVMLFVVASQLLMNIADPDKAASGEASTGKLAKNIIISLVAIVLLPTAFKYLYAIQKAVVTENIIGNIIVGGYSGSTSADFATMVKNTGKDMAFTTFSAFINPAGYAGNNDKGCENSVGLTYCTLYNKINKYGSADYGKISVLNTQQVRMELDSAFSDGSPKLEYRWGLSTLAGIMIAYFLLSFSIDMGVRVAKLAYYQLIAPIPIVLRIIPKKQDVFDNWVKGLMGTYLGVFIRLMVVYFCIFLINVIPAAWNNIVSSGGGSDRSIVNALVMIMLVFGVFIFMKEAPKLISSMLGVSDGDMSLGIGKKLAGAAVIGGLVAKGQAAGKKYAGKAWGGLTGGLGGGWNSMVNGEGFGMGFRVGGLGGYDAGGWQGRNQANELTRARFGNPKAKAGAFGGLSFGTKYRTSTSTAKTTAFTDASKARIEDAIRNNPKYGDARSKFFGAEFNRLANEISRNPGGAEATKFSGMTTKERESYFESHVDSKMQELSQVIAGGDGERLEKLKSTYGLDDAMVSQAAAVGKVMGAEAKREADRGEAKAKDDAAKFLEKIAADAAKAKPAAGSTPAGGSTPPPGGGATGGKP